MKTFFVSSTFKDMHFERDAIREITLPRLNALAREYGESVSFCDLRWGIDTSEMSEEVSSDKVIRVCLDEIDRCKPPLVVMLGDRYGWIPDKELVRGVASYKNLVIDDLEKSVTALEVEYGAMSPERQFEHTLVYFRRLENPPAEYMSEDEEHKRKLDELKRRVAALPNATVKEYNARWDGKALLGVNEFAKTLSDDLFALMRPEWERAAEATPFERERYIQQKYVEEKSGYFSGREKFLERTLDEIRGGRLLTFIKGKTGSGKSVIFSTLAMRLKDEGFDVLPFIGGYTRESNDATDIIRNTIKYIELKLGKSKSGDTGMGAGIQGASVEDLQNTLCSLANEYVKSGRRLVIMLDGVEKLYADDVRDKLQFIPENLSENLRFVITANDSFRTVGIDYITLGLLERDEIEPVIRGMLKRYSRELDKEVIRQIASVEEANNPLYLSLLIKRLLMMNIDDFFKIKESGDGMGAISHRQLELISECPKEATRMSSALIWEAARRVNPTLIIPVLEYIALSRFGLRDDDLAALMGKEWSPVDFAHFLSYMSDFFIMRNDGRFDFSHSATREGILAECEEKERKLRELFLHFESLDEKDGIRVSEIIYHATLARENDFVVNYLGKKTGFDIVNEPSKYEDDVKSMHSVLRQYGTDTLIAIIKNAKMTPESVGFVLFVVGALVQKFTSRQEDIKLAVDILEECNGLAERLERAKVKTATECRLTASFVYITALALHDPKNYRSRVGKEIDASLREIRSLYKKSKTEERRSLLILYLNISSTYYSFIEGRDNTQHAIELFEESMALMGNEGEQRRANLANLAQLHLGLGDKKSVLLAQKYIDEALAKSESVSPSMLSTLYHVKGLVCFTLGGAKNIEKAIEIYTAAYSNAQKAYSHSGDMDDLGVVLNCRNNLVKAYMDTGKAEYVDDIIKLTHENVRIAELMAAELKTLASLRELIPYLMNAAQIYQNIGGEKNFARALEFLKRADEVSVEISSRISNHNASVELAVQKAKIAQLVSVVNTPENVERARNLCNEAIEIGQRLCLEKEFVSDAYTVISFAYSILTLALCNADKNRENSYRPAIEAGEEAVKYAEMLEERIGDDATNTLFTAYNNLALTYQLNYQNNLQLSDYYAEQCGSRERLEFMICELAKSRPYEEVSIFDVDEELEYTDETDLLLEALESGDDADFDAALEKMVADSEATHELAMEIFNAARMRAIEYYEKAMKAIERHSGEDADLQTLSSLSIIYQNIGSLSLLGGENSNPTLATEMLEKALKIAEKQHALLGSLTTELGLVRARISLINAFIESEATKKSTALIKDTVKLCEHLNAEWETAETRTNLIAIYNTEILFAIRSESRHEIKAAIATAQKLIDLHEKIYAEGDTSLSEQYFTALNFKTSLTLMAGFIIPTKLMQCAKEAYEKIKAIYDSESFGELKAFFEAASTYSTFCTQLGLTDGGECYELMCEVCRAESEISDYVLNYDVEVERDDEIARKTTLLNTVMALTQHPLCSEEEMSDKLIDGFYAAKLIYDIYSDNDEARGLADLFISYAELKFAELPDGVERFREMKADLEEISDGEEDDDLGDFNIDDLLN